MNRIVTIYSSFDKVHRQRSVLAVVVVIALIVGSVILAEVRFSRLNNPALPDTSRTSPKRVTRETAVARDTIPHKPLKKVMRHHPRVRKVRRQKGEDSTETIAE